MHAITDADREAAQLLRGILADISGFWHKTGDDSPLCQALARHRLEGEQRLAGKLAPFLPGAPKGSSKGTQAQTMTQQGMMSLPRFCGPVQQAELEIRNPEL